MQADKTLSLFDIARATDNLTIQRAAQLLGVKVSMCHHNGRLKLCLIGLALRFASCADLEFFCSGVIERHQHTQRMTDCMGGEL